MARLLRANGGIEPILDALTYPVMTRLVGGYIEVVVLREHGDGAREILVLDEEGRLKEKPVNFAATMLYGRDYLVGDVIHCLVRDAGRATERYE